MWLFSSVFNKDPGEVDLVDFNKSSNEMDSIKIDKADIIKRYNNLNVYKSASTILKESREVLALNLTLKIIYECSLEIGTLPSDWKSANITPIFKRKGQKIR